MIDTDGNLVTTYRSARDAFNDTGVKPAVIRKCANGTQRTAGGYNWWYVPRDSLV